jgi:hypothetical protein
MVVNDLHVVSAPVTPHETHTPLIVNPDAVLSLSVSVQSLKPVPRRGRKILKFNGGIEHPELSPGDLLAAPTDSRPFPGVKEFCPPAAKRSNHQHSLYYASRNTGSESVELA